MGAPPLLKELGARRCHSLHSLCKHILGVCVGGGCLLKAGAGPADACSRAGAVTVLASTAGAAQLACRSSRLAGLQPPGDWLRRGGPAPCPAGVGGVEARRKKELRLSVWAAGWMYLAGARYSFLVPGPGLPGGRWRGPGRWEAFVETAPLISPPWWRGACYPSELVACSRQVRLQN